MEVESRQERGFADKSAERERKREREREGEGKRERERERGRAVVKRGLKLRKTFVRKWRSGIENRDFHHRESSPGLWCMK